MGIFKHIFRKRKDSVDDTIDKSGEIIVNYHSLVKKYYKDFKRNMKHFMSTQSKPQRLNYSTRARGAYDAMSMHYNKSKEDMKKIEKIFNESPESENKIKLKKEINSMRVILDDMEKMINDAKNLLNKNNL